MDPKAIEAIRKDDTLIVAPAAVAKTVTDSKVLANGEKTLVHGVSIEAIPMYNLTRGPEPGKLFHDKGRGNGYVILAIARLVRTRKHPAVASGRPESC